MMAHQIPYNSSTLNTMKNLFSTNMKRGDSSLQALLTIAQ